MIDPGDENDGETQQECKDGWGNMLQCPYEISSTIYFFCRRNFDVDNQQRYCYGKYTIAKSFESRAGGSFGHWFVFTKVDFFLFFYYTGLHLLFNRISERCSE